MSSKRHDSKTIIVHKFAQKYRFKGSWDATGKIVKERILNNELKNYRCANAWDCYVKLSKDLSMNGEENKTKKLIKYEEGGDERVLRNTTLTTKRTFVGFATQNITDYDRLVSNTDYNHIVYTDRESIPDMKPLVDTLKISQVSGEYDQDTATGKWSTTASFLPCSCPNCRNNPNDCNGCSYKTYRQSSKKLVSEIDKNAAENDDPLGLRKLKVKELRMELEERGITWKGLLKNQLVATLTASLQSEHEVDVEQEDGAAEDGAALKNVLDNL